MLCTLGTLCICRWAVAQVESQGTTCFLACLPFLQPPANIFPPSREYIYTQMGSDPCSLCCPCSHCTQRIPLVVHPNTPHTCLQTNFNAEDYAGEAIPRLSGKTREEVKTTLKSERIKVWVWGGGRGRKSCAVRS